MAMVARMRLCSSLRPPSLLSHSVRIQGHRSAAWSDLHCGLPRQALSPGCFSRAAPPGSSMAKQQQGVQMGMFKGSSFSRTQAQFSAAAQSSPEESEDAKLISGGILSDHGAGGHGREDGGGGGGGGGQGEPQSGGHRPLHPVLAWYMKMLEERPVMTKAVTAAILTFVGDLFTQLVIEKSGGVAVKRIAVITSLGLMLVGPTLHYWYLTLSKIVKIGGVKGVGVRLLLDQLFFSPIFIGVFFVCLLTMEGRPSDIGPKLRQDWPSAVITNWKLWVPFQCINFMFVPQQLQVAFANLVSIIWNAYLSFATHTEVGK